MSRVHVGVINYTSYADADLPTEGISRFGSLRTLSADGACTVGCILKNGSIVPVTFDADGGVAQVNGSDLLIFGIAPKTTASPPGVTNLQSANITVAQYEDE